MIKPFFADAHIGLQVRIYRNLHNGLLSVQGKVNGRWKVLGHTDTIYLKDVTFKVSQQGRMRVLIDKRKNVHAFIIGTIYECYIYPENLEPIFYNPYKNNNFCTLDKIPVSSADYCIIENCKPQISL